MTDDIGDYPFVRARWFTEIDPSSPRPLRVVVIHDMEAPEKGDTAENVAEYFRTVERKASAHLCVDNNSIVRCVHDKDVAYAAPGCNHDGLHIELAGYGKQTRDEWLDDYGHALLERAAEACADYCQTHGIPAEHLTNAQLHAGQKGLVGHYQVSQVYHESDHTDPGPGFPWDVFVQLVQGCLPQDGEHV